MQRSPIAQSTTELRLQLEPVLRHVRELHIDKSRQLDVVVPIRSSVAPVAGGRIEDYREELLGLRARGYTYVQLTAWLASPERRAPIVLALTTVFRYMRRVGGATDTRQRRAA